MIERAGGTVVVIERAGGVAHNQTAGGYSVPCGNFLYKFLTSIYIYTHTHTHTFDIPS